MSSSSEAANIGVVGLAVMGSNLARNLASREGNTVAVYNRSPERTRTLVERGASTAQALEIFDHWRPHVLVSDIGMPGEDGYVLIRKLRERAAARGGDTPAVALTAYGRMQDRHRAIAAGYDMHVPKPVDPGELTAIIAGISDRPLRF